MNARIFDTVLVGILRQSQVARVVADDVLDKLKIKQSVVDPQPIYGDICQKCATDLEKDISLAIKETTLILTQKIELLAKRTKARPQESGNREWWDKMTKDIR